MRLQRHVYFQLCACSHIWTSKINIHVSDNQNVLREDIQGVLIDMKVVYILLRNSYKTALMFSAEGICVCMQVSVRVLEEQKKKTFHEYSY